MLTIPSFFQENILSKSRTLTVENKFSVPVVVHSLDLPEQARQVFQLGKFKAKVSIANYLYFFYNCFGVFAMNRIRIFL